ncbi:MAG: hypothetical protein S4CHLAM6_08190 [Chlamydiae bacterium]|nr:hypothetical protein [Chlamydiota bacterium]
MAQKAIREYDAKRLLSQNWEKYFQKFNYNFHCALVHNGQELKDFSHDWLKQQGLVVKPDMLFGKRGLNQLVYLQNKKIGDVDCAAASKWIDEQIKEPKTLICGTRGMLNTFIVEPFTKHEQSEEYYISCTTEPDGDILYLSAHGGVEVEQNWDSVNEIKISLNLSDDEILKLISKNIPIEVKQKEKLSEFALSFYQLFRDLHFCYLELNPFILRDQDVYILDVVARVDDTARFLMQNTWKELEFPSAFGEKEITEIEKGIEKLDEKSGASLKLSVLNLNGKVWMLAAGGGASVVYADCIANLWGTNELANYGEYSGNPSTEETYYYAKGVLDLMTRRKDPQNRKKILIIGGAIANFTDVAKTFDGIIKAFNEMHEKMREVGVQIYVRRGGPNYEIGLKNIETAATRLGLSIKVYGPETHLTDIVRLAQVMQNEGVNV